MYMCCVEFRWHRKAIFVKDLLELSANRNTLFYEVSHMTRPLEKLNTWKGWGMKSHCFSNISRWAKISLCFKELACMLGPRQPTYLCGRQLRKKGQEPGGGGEIQFVCVIVWGDKWPLVPNGHILCVGASLACCTRNKNEMSYTS